MQSTPIAILSLPLLPRNPIPKKLPKLLILLQQRHNRWIHPRLVRDRRIRPMIQQLPRLVDLAEDGRDVQRCPVVMQ